MTLNYNKKKINILPNLRVIKYLFIFLFFSLSFVFIYNELKNKNKLYDFIHHVSEKFNYQLKNYEINSLHRVEKNEVVKILNKYLDQSIFLIPLSDISNSIYNLNWVKSVNLSTNLKNKIEVEISEYNPVGLFYYNKQFFYFSEEGKIIDTYLNNNSENFIIFQGVRVLRKANDFLIILEKYKNSLSNIKEAYYVNERRWDIKLNNEILINLSETDIEESIKNYIKLINKLSDSEIISIKRIDLRNNNKAIISFK